MKAILIKDAVYLKLLSFKKSKSFSDFIDELLEESKITEPDKIKKYSGIIGDKKANSTYVNVRKLRKNLTARLSST